MTCTRRQFALFTATLFSVGCSPQPTGGARPSASPGPSGSAAAGPNSARALSSVMLAGVPHVRQKPDFCGEAVTESWLRKLGRSIDQDQVFNISGMDPARGMGLTTREMKTALGRLGFKTGQVWHQLPAAESELGLARLFSELHRDLTAGVPSIVCTHFDEGPRTTEHFRLILGYDQARDEVIYHDPAIDSGGYLRMPRERLLRLWPLKYEPGKLTVIRLRLEQGNAGRGAGTPEPGAPSAPRYSNADYSQHVMKIAPKIPRGFSVVVEPPFVVVGDGGMETVKRRAEGTVRWAVERLQRAYFEKQPDKILTIWLFDGKRSYEQNTVKIFGSAPSTPYGYYSSSDEALVMNIATGGGTLVHEIVHPFVEANFPNAPAWLNEGLGSLYEQSADRGGEIVGLTNWRLAGLQRAIRAGRVPSFRALTATTDHEFYERDPGTNYSQARYLMYYLQERGLLRKYYRMAHSLRRADASGYQALVEVLGKPDMARFKTRWERWVSALRF